MHKAPEPPLRTNAPVRRRLLQGLAALAASPLALRAAAQSTYPAKPIVIRVAFPPGGPADVSIRAASVVLQRQLGQNLIAENLPGANGSISAMAVLRAPADGYTLLGTTGTDFLVAPLTIPSARYQPGEFKLAGVVGISDFLLAASPRHTFKRVDDVIARARDKNQPPLTIAHWGIGSAPHIVGADFQARTGVTFIEVPYKGAAPSIADVAGGQVDLTFVPLGGPTLGMVQTGRVRAIGVASAVRNSALPDVPTLMETPSLTGFEYSQWSALLAPPGTPEPIVERLNTALNAWVISPENAERIATNASRRLDPMSPAQAAAFLKAEHDKFTRVARAMKLVPANS